MSNIQWPPLQDPGDVSAVLDAIDTALDADASAIVGVEAYGKLRKITDMKDQLDQATRLRAAGIANRIQRDVFGVKPKR